MRNRASERKRMNERYATDEEYRRRKLEQGRAYRARTANYGVKAPPNAAGNWTGVMDDWTEWHPLPFDVLYKMGDAENRLYCEWYMKAHPLDLEIVAENLHLALQKWRDEIEHLTGEM